MESGAGAIEPQRREWPTEPGEQTWRTDQGSGTLWQLRVGDDPHVYQKEGNPLPLLRLCKCPPARLEQVHDAIGIGAGVGGSSDPKPAGLRPGPGDAFRDPAANRGDPRAGYADSRSRPRTGGAMP